MDGTYLGKWASWSKVHRYNTGQRRSTSTPIFFDLTPKMVVAVTAAVRSQARRQRTA